MNGQNKQDDKSKWLNAKSSNKLCWVCVCVCAHARAFYLVLWISWNCHAPRIEVVISINKPIINTTGNKTKKQQKRYGLNQTKHK